ncbi:histidine phosphatase family protein [Roseovarius sp. ZX-A-9]|uniref:histidine phosphatase family protein n=1 Tax=Roseovarius sp. ZX-A-9 TaxID=3014783 RepID=UPI00232DCEFE|nr:histidine phosphatase family protein [Roseovarius sp. ZX-A-9]
MEKDSPTTIVLLRHGRTTWNRAGILIGQKDIPLDAGGRQEAKSAVGSLAGIDAIYSSPLSRCRETASIIGECLELPVTFIRGLSERHWGAFEGRPKSERNRSQDPEGGESAEAFRARVEETLRHIVGAKPLIVTHSGVIRLLCAHPHEVIPHAEPIESSYEKVASLRR